MYYLQNHPVGCPLRLMNVWRITGKIIRTAIIVTYAQLQSEFLQFYV